MANRQIVIRIKTIMKKKDYDNLEKRIKQQNPNVIVIPHNAELVTLADRPQEWIPCSEKLPSENGDYLVTLENGVVKILGYSTTQRTTYPKGFYHIEDGFSWRQIQNPVVAWMPLPEAWKGVDDERP